MTMFEEIYQPRICTDLHLVICDANFQWKISKGIIILCHVGITINMQKTCFGLYAMFILDRDKLAFLCVVGHKLSCEFPQTNNRMRICDPFHCMIGDTIRRKRYRINRNVKVYSNVLCCQIQYQIKVKIHNNNKITTCKISSKITTIVYLSKTY